MNKDAYKQVAGIYDRIFEPMNKGLRVLGFRMFLPPRGASILDVGCGTGVYLEMYHKFECSLHGIDTSPAMLKVARERLGDDADLRNVDASKIPHQDGFFDLVLSMLVLHEMEDVVRNAVLQEMKRVVKPDGRILLIDFHVGDTRPVKGWLFKIIILLSEIAAGRRHFRNYRNFASIGGLPTLIERAQLKVEKERVVGNGNMALYLLAPD
jgi:ubiquinone/menaquinone biosynthesis C-methylase UbiE